MSWVEQINSWQFYSKAIFLNGEKNQHISGEYKWTSLRKICVRLDPEPGETQSGTMKTMVTCKIVFFLENFINIVLCMVQTCLALYVIETKGNMFFSPN